MERVDFGGWFEEIDMLSEKTKIVYINTLQALMNLRQYRARYLTTDEIHDRLHRSRKEFKPGELGELENEIPRSSETITPELASELADIAYYGLQPNAQYPDSISELCSNSLIDFIGIPHSEILTFCIIKYSIRISTDQKDKNYKEKEYEALKIYLDSHPEIRDLWKKIEPVLPS